MLAGALLAAILGEGVLGIEVAPVAVAAQQSGGAEAIGGDVEADLAIGEVGVAGLVIEPGDARGVQVFDLLGLHHAVFYPGFQPGVLGRLQDAIGVIGGNAAARVLDDIVRRIADFHHGVAVVPGVLVAGNPDHHGVEALLHLVVGAQVERGIAAAAPRRVAAPGAVQIVV